MPFMSGIRTSEITTSHAEALSCSSAPRTLVRGVHGVALIFEDRLQHLAVAFLIVCD
jgi:hypothetical protein